MIKSAIAMVLAALATTSTAVNPTAAEPKINSVFRATTAEVTGVEYNAGFVTSTLVTADGHEWAVCDELAVDVEYLAVFDTMGTGNILDDEIITMIPIKA